MFVTSVLMQKGGVAKTTIAREVAAILAQWGFRVVLVDGDPQGTNTEATLSRSVATGTAELLGYRARVEGRKTLTDVAVRSEEFGFDVIGSNFISMDEQELSLKNDSVDGNNQFQEALAASDESAYDFVIYDGPPRFGPYMVNGAIAADGVIVPVESAQESLHALSLLMGTFARYEKVRGGPVPVLAGIVTKFESAANVDRGLLEDVRSAQKPGTSDSFFPRVLTVRKTTAFKRAFEMRKPLWKIAKGATEKTALNEVAAVAALLVISAKQTLPKDALKIEEVRRVADEVGVPA